jgi:hypothetical protein
MSSLIVGPIISAGSIHQISSKALEKLVPWFFLILFYPIIIHWLYKFLFIKVPGAERRFSLKMY